MSAPTQLNTGTRRDALCGSPQQRVALAETGGDEHTFRPRIAKAERHVHALGLPVGHAQHPRRLRGGVDEASKVRVGAPVEFTVRGYDQSFAGRIERIAPQADSTTRQVPIFVAIPNVGGRLVAGLFAEGRVVAQTASGLVVPVNAVNTTAQAPWVLRVTDGKTERVNVTLGLRDPRTERVLVASGLAADDTLLRGASQGITPGTSVQLSGR